MIKFKKENWTLKMQSDWNIHTQEVEKQADT